MNSKKRTLHAGIEATYGVMLALAASNAILTIGLEIMPMEGGTIELDYDRPTYGANPQIHVGVHGKVKFKVPLVGSGTLGTAPAFGPLLLACGTQEIVVATTSVEYKPMSNSTTSLTMEFNLDGNRHRLIGARGNAKLDLESKKIPMIEFEFTGLFVNPDSAAPLATTGWNLFQTPEPVQFASTPTVELGGVTTGWVLKKKTLDFGNEVQHFDNPGEESVQIVDRVSKGDIQLLARLNSSYNAFTQAKANTLQTFKVVHGSVANRRVIIAAPALQLLQPKYDDDSGRASLTANTLFTPTSANDDDWSIKFAAA